jgi:iron complex transport system ATP-binding protein
MILKASRLGLAGRLFDVSLTIEAGELVALVGPNGSGKTSLLHALAGIGPAQGEVSICGVDPRRLGPAAKPQYLTYLPASRDVTWPMRAADLIALGGEVRSIAGLELGQLLERRVDTLSTGQRSRILIARALVPSPKLLLLDEPTANLDPLWQFRLMELLRDEVGNKARAALVALHDLDLAEHYADRILVMAGGRVAAEGLSGAHMAKIFGIEREAGRWAPISSPAGPRSLP